MPYFKLNKMATFAMCAHFILTIVCLQAGESFRQNKLDWDQGCLKLTVSCIKKEYCQADEDLDSLRMKIKLRFFNDGRRPVILYKDASLVSEISIRPTPQSGINWTAPQVTTLSHYLPPQDVLVATERPSASFIVIEPQSAYELESYCGVFTSRDEKKQINGAIGTGSFELQLTILTWPENAPNAPNEIIGEVRQRWQRYGYLWSEPILSEPMSFTIEQKQNVNKKCEESSFSKKLRQPNHSIN
jgi:hypothetical protein